MRAICAVVCQKWTRTAWLCALLCSACAQPAPFDAPELSLAFVAVETRTSEQDGQTLAHQELTGLAFLPGDRGLIAWEKSGRVVHYRRDSDDVLTRLGEFWIADVDQESDCGLISVALDPDWEHNHFLFAGHCVDPYYSQVTRYQFDPQPTDGDDDYADITNTAQTVIQFGDADADRPWHNVGAIGFFGDTEHSMWILAGDKHRAENAQDHDTNLGGILRIIPHRGKDAGYDPHPDNPFGGPGSDPDLQSSPDLYAWGLRSPWRGAIDQRGRIWVGDVGERFEEINLSTAPGQNFGWSNVDGPCNPSKGSCSEYTDPVVSWAHGSDIRYVREDENAHPSGYRVAWVGTPYSSPMHNDPYAGILDDSVLVSDMCVGWVRAVSADKSGKVTRDAQIGHIVGLSGAAQAADGQLYVTSYGDCTSDTFGVGGGIYRAVLHQRATPQPVPRTDHHQPLVDDPLGPMPMKLSETGIFADISQRTPNARAIEYEPAWPLWSNGSSKQRLLFLPQGQRIDNSRRDHWEPPVGTFFVKSFSFADSTDTDPVETRIIRRTAEGWDYEVYSWRDGDAYLLALDQPTPALIKWSDKHTLTHEIPSRFDCKSCHEHNETVIIGFDELRLNSPRGDSDQTQLEQLAAGEVFSDPLPADPLQVTSDDDRTRRVLGYLHGNCAHCHNGSPHSESAFDLTFQHALSNVIGRETVSSGQAVGIRVVPGSPERSLLFLAFSGEGDDPELKPMPPVGVQLQDTDSIELIRDWIEDLPY